MCAALARRCDAAPDADALRIRRGARPPCRPCLTPPPPARSCREDAPPEVCTHGVVVIRRPRSSPRGRLTGGDTAPLGGYTDTDTEGDAHRGPLRGTAAGGCTTGEYHPRIIIIIIIITNEWKRRKTTRVRERTTYTHTQRERERETDRQRQRQTDRERQRDRRPRSLPLSPPLSPFLSLSSSMIFRFYILSKH